MDLGLGFCVHHNHQSAVSAGGGTGTHPQAILLQVPAYLPCGAGSGHAQWRRSPSLAASCKYITDSQETACVWCIGVLLLFHLFGIPGSMLLFWYA